MPSQSLESPPRDPRTLRPGRSPGLRTSHSPSRPEEQWQSNDRLALTVAGAAAALRSESLAPHSRFTLEGHQKRSRL